MWEKFIDQIEPLGARLVVSKPLCQEIEESREIVIPDTAKEISKEFGLECEVLKIGPAVKEDVSVGDTIVIPEFGGMPIVMGVEVPFWMVGEGDILAVVRRGG